MDSAHDAPDAPGTPFDRFDPARKLLSQDEAQARFRGRPGTVFTNGVFDVLHRGHVAYLAAARALGDRLIVAVNSDASARRLGKGPDRPLNRAQDRAFLLAGLESVDAVVEFEEDTPLAVLARLQPGLYVKGGDYDMATLAETPLVHSWGGRSLALPFVDGYSTTALVRRIRG
ncbi:MAG: adenylyltransferase/cytidyltransferase family protein [Burkholderiales bacterium]|nr:adenylyltransferase/cytidyltransferase family protein [Burkholderiales bacterium]